MESLQEFNQLNNVQFKVDIHRLPTTTFWVKSAILPSVTLEGGEFPTPNREIPVPGHKLTFDPLSLIFIADQKLINYEEILIWIDQINKANYLREMVSDISFHILTANMNIARTINFYGCYPSYIGEVNLNSDDSDVIQIDVPLTINYQYYNFSDVSIINI